MFTACCTAQSEQKSQWMQVKIKVKNAILYFLASRVVEANNKLFTFYLTDTEQHQQRPEL